MAQSASAGVDLASFAHPILINLPERSERLADSVAELSKASGRPIEVGRDAEVINPARFAQAGGFANPAYRSNLDAHLRAARWARESGHERVLVLEDDVAFGPVWSTWAPGLLEQLSDRPWLLANLGYLDAWGEAPVRPDVALPGSESFRPRGVGWARFDGRVNGSHAYFLHETILDDWIDHLEAVLTGTPGDNLRGPMSSDGAINTFFWIDPDRIRLVVTPNVAGTRPTRSDITPGPVDRLPVVGEVAEAIRRWSRRRSRESAINYR